MIENETGLSIPKALANNIEKTFLDLYNIYEGIIYKNLHLNNQTMQDAFGEKTGKFQYESILKRLSKCKERILSKIKQVNKSCASLSLFSSSGLNDLPSQSDSNVLGLS